MNGLGLAQFYLIQDMCVIFITPLKNRRELIELAAIGS